jgi:hypothetical protein
VERNRIISAIIIDSQSGGFWGASPPQNPERLILLKIVTLKGNEMLHRGVKIGGKKGSIFNGNLQTVQHDLRACLKNNFGLLNEVIF